MRHIFLTSVVLVGLSGCATTSFAPPQVNVHKAMNENSLGPGCRLTTHLDARIDEDVNGAQSLIDNYLDSYQCAMRLAADGRQAFEIPQFLALIGSTTALALGAGTDVAILGGAGNSVFAAGKNYYAPGEQTEILSDAVDALACIQAESVGISAFSIAATEEQQRMQMSAAGGGPIVEVSAELQYFKMVSSALVSVNRAATKRLSRRGSFDVAGVAAEIEVLAKKIRDAEEAKKNPPKAAVPDPAAGGAGVRMALALNQSEKTQLDLNILQPKLQTCVLRAKS